MSEFIKPQDYNMDYGDRVRWRIIGNVKEGKGNDLYSIPVEVIDSSKPIPKDALTKGAVGLNKTHAKMFVKKFSRETDNWVGGVYYSVVNAGRNPTTGQQVPTWLILENSILSKEEYAKEKASSKK